jgi:hypothetical protein
VSRWAPPELKAHLAAVVDQIVGQKDGGSLSPLDVALTLLGEELEAFVLFGRMGHLDPPRPDGTVQIAVLQQQSENPEIDQRIREAVRQWMTKN